MKRTITPEQLAAIDLMATDVAVYLPGAVKQTDVNGQTVWLDLASSPVESTEEDKQ